MSRKMIRENLAKIFNELADTIETGEYGKKIRVGVTTPGGELGINEIIKGAEIAAVRFNDIEVVLIGPEAESDLEIVYKTESEKEAHTVMETMLAGGEIDACVTRHYSFPVGVSTVGRVITPALGRELIITTSTGTSATERVNAMVKNAIHGIIVARSLGIEDPSLGILNVDGSRRVKQILYRLVDRGYDIRFAESIRSDGGCIMRGNDLLTASADVIVTDTLTGNLLIKIFSSFTTGGSYEAFGYGYGPGVGEGYRRVINIVSRASGAPVIANSIRYAADVVKGNITDITAQEYEAVKRAGLEDLLISGEGKVKGNKDKIKSPDSKTVSEEITGIDIMVLDEAKTALWKESVYAETGMGCSGPVILVAGEDKEKAERILKEKDYII